MRIDYKEREQKRMPEPVWLGIVAGLSCFGAAVATTYLVILITL